MEVIEVLVTDWDETATVSDTTTMLATLGAVKNPGVSPDFDYYSNIYSRAYEAYSSVQLQRSSVEEEIEFQKGMQLVEISSINALEKNKYFKNITAQDLADLVSKVSLRPGFVETMRSFAGPKYILSVNWCRKLIELVLLAHGISDLTVMANDFEYDSVGTSTGAFDHSMSIRTGYDKLVKLQQIRANHESCHLIYVGDSSGDVLPIVKADAGIIIEGGRGLGALEHLATVLPLTNMNSTNIGNTSKCAYQGTWTDIARVLRLLQ